MKHLKLNPYVYPVFLCSLLLLLFSLCSSDGNTAGQAQDTPNENLNDVLVDLGINTEQSPRKGPDGSDLPENYSPLGSNYSANRFAEILLLGPEMNDAGLSTAPGTMPYTNLNAAAGNTYSWEIINHDDNTAQPYSQPAVTRDAAVGDFDSDGFDETAIAWQHTNGVKLVLKDDSKGSFALQQPIEVDNGNYSAVFLAAGDLNGNGQTDLLLALVKANGDAVVKMLENDNGSLAYNGKSFSIAKNNYNIGQLIIKTGNLDYDPARETAIVVNAGALTADTNGTGSVEHHYLLLDDANTGFKQLKKGKASVTEAGSTTAAAVGNVDLGDVDGDGIDEVVLAGLNQTGGVSSYNDYKYLVQVLDDARAGFSVFFDEYADTTLPGENLQPNSSGASHRLNHVLVVTADLDGDGAAEFLVNQHIYQSLKSSGGNLQPYHDGSEVAQIPSSWFFTGSSSGRSHNFNWQTAAVAAADVTSDGRENIVLYTQRDWSGLSPAEQPLTVWGHDQIDGFKTMALYNNVRSAGNTQAKVPRILLPDSDGDDQTAALRYSAGSHELVFTEPLIIAALAASPCAKNLGQSDESCRTAYGTSVNDTTTTTNGSSLTAGVHVGYGIDDPVTSNSIEIAGSLQKTINRYTSQSYSLSKSLTYETGVHEDSVVLTVLPMDVYTYQILSHPDPALSGGELVVSLPREPVTTMVTVEYYNSIVDREEMRIGTGVFEHTSGQPASYPTAVEKNSLLNTYDGLQSNTAVVGQGSGQTRATITAFTQTTTGKQYEFSKSLDVRVTGGLLGGYILGGFNIGHSTNSSLEVSRGQETVYQGSVGNIDTDSYNKGQSYSWGLFTYHFDNHASGQIFEVLNFWVD